MTKAQIQRLAQLHREIAELYSEIAEPKPRRPKRLPRGESTPEQRDEVERMLADRGIE